MKEANMGNVELLKINDEKVFFKAMKGSIKIIHDDFLTTNLIEENTIDLIVTSPPYNVSKEYDEDLSLKEYLEVARINEEEKKNFLISDRLGF